MPFLFVDYDQGAGGERFCAGLSLSPQCEKLEYIQYSNTGRTKVIDVFNQELLKQNPTYESKSSHPTLYTIVPTHRKTGKAQPYIKEKIRSIRIRMPDDERLFNHIKDQQARKVIEAREPTPEYFAGFVNEWVKKTGNNEFVKKVKYNMRNIDIILLSQGLEPTEENINQYLNELRNLRLPEPPIPFDLIIPYEDLYYNTQRVRDSVFDVFGIEIVGDWLDDYAKSLTKT